MTPDEIKKLRELANNANFDNECSFHKLQEIRDINKAFLKSLKPQNIISLLDHIDRLQRQNEIMKQALEFYAKPLLITLYNDEMMFVESESYEYRRRAIESLKDCEEIK